MFNNILELLSTVFSQVKNPDGSNVISRDGRPQAFTKPWAGLICHAGTGEWPCRVVFDGEYDWPRGLCLSFKRQAITLVETTLTTWTWVRRSFLFTHNFSRWSGMITTSKDGFARQVRRWDFEQPERLGFKDCDVDFSELKIDSAFALWGVRQYVAADWPARWETEVIWKKSDYCPLCVRYSDFEKLENTSFQWITRISGSERANLDHYDYGGPRTS